jgi:NAD(P)-dependent dehydrogenase (short-subunit alcohol dehydrogenase family)
MMESGMTRAFTSGANRHIVLIDRTEKNVGRALARLLGERGHDLMLHGASAALVADLRARCPGRIEAVDDSLIAATGQGSLETAEGYSALAAAALDCFGRIDGAFLYPPAVAGTVFARGPLLDSDPESLTTLQSYVMSTFHALRAIIPAMRAGGGGQIAIVTSATAKRPQPGWSCYASARAGQTMLVQAAALEHAAEGISINAVGTKYVVGPQFPNAPEGTTDSHVPNGDWSAADRAEIPMGRMGAMDELAALVAPLVDGSCRYQTAQFVTLSGGWDAA